MIRMSKKLVYSVVTHFKLFDNDQGWKFQFWIHLETEEEGGNGLMLRAGDSVAVTFVTNWRESNQFQISECLQTLFGLSTFVIVGDKKL